MTKEDLERQSEFLAVIPEDWGTRLKLIEGFLDHGDVEEARRLVRESPDDHPVPPEVQYRLHELFSHANATARGAESARQEEATEETGIPEAEESVSFVVPEAEEVAPAYEVETGSIVDLDSEYSEEFPEEDKEALPVAVAEAIEVTDPEPDEALPAAKAIPLPDAIAEEVAEYERSLLPQGRQNNASQKISALTIALLAHVVFAFLTAVIYVAVQRPSPPQIVAAQVVQDRDYTIDQKVIQKDADPNVASASAQPVFALSSMAPSDVTVPEFDKSEVIDVTSSMIGVGERGMGLSFHGDNQQSQINFFGISSGGDRVAFIIDASPSMLVDEKGGMYAYDRVKDEIGQMLAGLNRGTSFDIYLYHGKRVAAFRSNLVPALPSNVREAVAWLDPLNRDYGALGLGNDYSLVTLKDEIEPIKKTELSGYTKAIQAALEQRPNAIFVIASGYERLREDPPKDMKRTGGAADPGEVKRWNSAVQRTRAWLKKENEARKSRGMAPKVVVNFNALVRQVTGQAPPQGGGGGGMRPKFYEPRDIEVHISNVVNTYFDSMDLRLPSINMVVFVGEGEKIGEFDRHFGNISRRNQGKMKILEGLAALENVTGNAPN